MSPNDERPLRRTPLLALLVAAATVVTFLPALRCAFVFWDDPQSVTRYAIVLRGLSLAGLEWAFTHSYFAHWLPLTVLSHMLDWELFGANAAGHHLTSLVLHTANAALVFLLWRRATGRSLRALAVAMLFAVHPLRVEAVVWVAARKDMLSGFFGLLALVLYVSWTRRPSRGRYVAVAIAMLLGLLAKPMVVSLPIAMLLLDFWPLARLRLPAAVGPPLARARAFAAGAWPLVREKLPLFALALAGAVGALVSQRLGGAMAGIAGLPLSVRLGNAAISYAIYLRQTFWPTGLAAFYAFPVPPAGWREVAAAAALFAAISAAALLVARRWPWVCCGWLWFVVCLLPVIGLVQVGDQARADRYTYLPSVGLLAALVWSGAELARGRRGRWFAGAATAAAVIVLALATRAQIATWHDTETVFSRVLAVEPHSHFGHLNLASWRLDHGEVDAAIAHYRLAIERSPDIALAWTGLGAALRLRGDRTGARDALTHAVALAPDLARAHLQLAAVYEEDGDLGPAAGHLARAVSLEPGYRQAWQGLAEILARPGAAGQALPYVTAVARSEPGSLELRRLVELVRARAAQEAGPPPGS